MVENELVHLHPAPDQSLHAMLPPALALEAIEAGWAEQHPVARRGWEKCSSTRARNSGLD